MFDIDPPRCSGADGEEKHCTFVIGVRHQVEDLLHEMDLKAALEALDGSVAFRDVGPADGTHRTDVVVLVPAHRTTQGVRVVNSHFHCLNLHAQIDHNEDSAKDLIAAAGKELMGLPMLRRLRRACVIDMIARQKIVAGTYISGLDELAFEYRARLERERDVALTKIHAIDAVT